MMERDNEMNLWNAIEAAGNDAVFVQQFFEQNHIKINLESKDCLRQFFFRDNDGSLVFFSADWDPSAKEAFVMELADALATDSREVYVCSLGQSDFHQIVWEDGIPQLSESVDKAVWVPETPTGFQRLMHRVLGRYQAKFRTCENYAAWCRMHSAEK